LARHWEYRLLGYFSVASAFHSPPHQLAPPRRGSGLAGKKTFLLANHSPNAVFESNKVFFSQRFEYGPYHALRFLEVL
jgi:hypothetical protein